MCPIPTSWSVDKKSPASKIPNRIKQQTYNPHPFIRKEVRIAKKGKQV